MQEAIDGNQCLVHGCESSYKPPHRDTDSPLSASQLSHLKCLNFLSGYKLLQGANLRCRNVTPRQLCERKPVVSLALLLLNLRGRLAATLLTMVDFLHWPCRCLDAHRRQGSPLQYHYCVETATPVRSGTIMCGQVHTFEHKGAAAVNGFAVRGVVRQLQMGCTAACVLHCMETAMFQDQCKR